MFDGMFLSPANRMGHEEVGAFLAVARVRLAPDRPSQPFLNVLGAPSVPWDFEINTRQALGADATGGWAWAFSTMPTHEFSNGVLYPSVYSCERGCRRRPRPHGRRQRRCPLGVG
jgi:hypothetical protein